MAVYLSPGVYPREIDLSVLPAAVGPLRPAFIGTTKKGPVNAPTLISSAQQAIDIFGEPFAESYLMYSVLGYLEEGNNCYVTRVGIEEREGLESALLDVSIDTSGNRGRGWGRIPLFSSIDYGRLNLRIPTTDAPVVFHSSAVTDVTYNDASISATDGPTSAVLGVSGTYSGAVDDSYLLVITSPPAGSDLQRVAGAGYAIYRNSDGVVTNEGYLDDGDSNGVSEFISIGNGLSVRVNVSSGELETNDSFSFKVRPDNRSFSVSVEGGTGTAHTMPSATFTSISTMVSAINALVTAEDYECVSSLVEVNGVNVSTPQLKSQTVGERIQITSSKAWALELGSSLYAFDIPRAHLLATKESPYDVTSQNNRVKIEIISSGSTKIIEANVPNGIDQTAVDVASALDLAGSSAGVTFFEAFSITLPNGLPHLAVVTSPEYQQSTLRLVANYTNIKTLRFAEEVGVFPFSVGYRGFMDVRSTLPKTGTVTSTVPLSCELSAGSDQCADDSAYFGKIVGWLVAPSSGTWINGYTAALDQYTGIGDSAGRYNIVVRDNTGAVVERITDVSFDKRASRYISNVINPGSSIGGNAGSTFINWEPRPSFLDYDINSTNYDVRQPSLFGRKSFIGAANGIPIDAAYSANLDSAVIGNPEEATGLFAFQNIQNYDINLLATPGFSSGAVIANGLTLCENRGDVLYLVDPPFGLRPQQVVDWHNGILSSDQERTINSSYGSLYWSWVKVFDQFSSRNIWVPPCGHVAAIYSRTARDAEQWYAPAGLSRGRMLTTLDIEYSSTQGETDLMYGSGNAVNPLVKFPQSGVVVWGQRTLQRSATALDRVNVRMLLIYLKKAMIGLLRNFVFEPNDKVLWGQVTTTLIPFLADIQARRGLVAFKVVCDDTNNTAERTDRNELWVSVFIQPTKAVEFVALNIAVLRTGASFSAEEVLAAGGVIPTATAN